ncbi:MAG: TetR/AcrR family transcriptional regulator [Planctomycetota bacterium]|jgi:AcrR family transcriptional regulator
MSGATTAGVHRDPQKEAAILDCATEVFAEVGFQNAEMQVIAEKAGVGKGTVYRYFRSKEELFMAAADAGMKKLEVHIYRAIDATEGVIDLVWRAGLAYAEFFRDHPELVEIFIQERATFRGSIPDTHLVYRDRNRGVLEDALRDGIEKGVVRPIDVREATRALANVMYGTVVCGCLEGSSEKLPEMVKPAVELFLRGILVDPESSTH